MLNNRESAARQYALDGRAVQLGWPAERVVVVDEDQGRSGRTAEGRTGFAYLLGQVALNRVGIILGLETSRLARSNKDWHQLLDLCAIFQTLLADQDGVYDPTQYNDRLLLGLNDQVLIGVLADVNDFGDFNAGVTLIGGLDLDIVQALANPANTFAVPPVVTGFEQGTRGAFGPTM